MAEDKSSRPEGYWRVPQHVQNIDAASLSKLEAFYFELLRFNQKLNLISRKSELEADISQVLDCIVGGRIVLEATSSPSIYDVGSGNGLPGLVMAVLDPKRKLFLVDSDERKTEFLKLMVGRLGITNVTVIRGRFEEMKANTITCAVSRGFASITKALLLARQPFSTGGEYFHFKSTGWVREVAEIPSQMCSFWAPRLLKEYSLPVVTAKMAIVVTKKLG